MKKRLLGLDRPNAQAQTQGNKGEEKELTTLELVNQDPNSYLCRILKHVQREVEDKITDDDLQIILDFEEEQFRLGNFEKIFPCINNSRYYGQFFEYPRASNNLLHKYLSVINPKHNQHHMCFVPTVNEPIVADQQTAQFAHSPSKFAKQKTY